MTAAARQLSFDLTPPPPPRFFWERAFGELSGPEMKEHTEACRLALQRMERGDRKYFGPENGGEALTVTRVACAGVWFDVPCAITFCGKGESFKNVRRERLPLGTALSRVRSNHVVTYRPPLRPKKAECPVCGLLVALNEMRVMEHCFTCQMDMCFSCLAECGDRHETDPGHRREFSAAQLADLEDEMRLVHGVVGGLGDFVAAWNVSTARGAR